MCPLLLLTVNRTKSFFPNAPLSSRVSSQPPITFHRGSNTLGHIHGLRLAPTYLPRLTSFYLFPFTKKDLFRKKKELQSDMCTHDKPCAHIEPNEDGESTFYFFIKEIFNLVAFIYF